MCRGTAFTRRSRWKISAVCPEVPLIRPEGVRQSATPNPASTTACTSAARSTRASSYTTRAWPGVRVTSTLCTPGRAVNTLCTLLTQPPQVMPVTDKMISLMLNSGRIFELILLFARALAQGFLGMVDQAISHHLGVDGKGAVGECSLDRFDLARVGDVDRGQLGFQRADAGARFSQRQRIAATCGRGSRFLRPLAFGGGYFGTSGRGDALVNFHEMDSCWPVCPEWMKLTFKYDIYQENLSVTLSESSSP